MRRTETLKPEEDAYGQELWAYYQGRECFEIVERDDGFIDVVPTAPKMYFSEYKISQSIKIGLFTKRRLWSL
jgi:hypothetical protein